MQTGGIGPALVRLVAPPGTADLLSELFVPGRVLQADVISVFENRAMLALGRGVRLEVTLQAAVQEGQHLTLQVQPGSGEQGPNGAPRPVVLKLVGAPVQGSPAQGSPLPAESRARGQVIPESPARAQTQAAPAQAQATPAQPQAAPAQAPAQAAPAQAPATPAQPQAAPAQAPATPAQAPAQIQVAPAPTQTQVMPQVLWLPIPLPGGRQGWAQIALQAEREQESHHPGGAQSHQLRLWWDTPALGPVQVTLDTREHHLTALFTAAGETRVALDASLPDLRRRLQEAGFPEPKLGSRAPLPGESPSPVAVPGLSLLDKRI